jgi:hypothetical protein
MSLKRAGIVALVVAGSAAPSAVASPASYAAAARADAAQLLTRLSLPPGSTPSAGAPAAGLADPAIGPPATPNVVDEHAWWVVPGPPAAALAYVDSHRPAGSQPAGTGSGNDVTSHEFAWFPVAGVLATRELVVAVAALPDGSTGLRADSQVVWLTPRPA